jgi:hypothetical protein
VIGLLLLGALPCAAPPAVVMPKTSACTAITYRSDRAAERSISFRDERGRLVRIERYLADGRLGDRTTFIRNPAGEAVYELADGDGDGAIDTVTSYVWERGELVERCRMRWPEGRLTSKLILRREKDRIRRELDEDGDGVIDERSEVHESSDSLTLSSDRMHLSRARDGGVVTEVLRSSDGDVKRIYRFGAFGLRSLEVDRGADGSIDAREEIERDALTRPIARRFFDRDERAPREQVRFEYRSFQLRTETWSDRIIRYEGSCPVIEPDRLAIDDAP